MLPSISKDTATSRAPKHRHQAPVGVNRPAAWRARRSGSLAAVAAAGLFLPGTRASAQDALQNVVNWESTIAHLQKGFQEENYNLKLGPVRMLLSAGASVEFNDNINLADTGRLADVIFSPTVGVSAFWNVSDLNRLSIDLGISYLAYVNNPKYDRFQVSLSPKSASQISYDFLVKGIKINVHDRFSFTPTPIQEGSVSGQADFGQIENLVGTFVPFELRDGVISFGYDHANYHYLNSTFSHLNRSAEMFFLRGSYHASATVETGLEGSASLIDYSSKFFSSSVNYSFGPFVDWHVSEFISTTARGGISYYSFDHNGVAPTGKPAAYYGSGSVNHVLNPYFSHSLGVDLSTSQGIDSNYQETFSVHYRAHANLLHNFELNPGLFFERGKETNPTAGEIFHRYGADIGTGYRLNQKTTLNITYRFTLKDSNLKGQDYTQNAVTMSGTYQF